MRHDPNILVGLQTSDDAAVYRLTEELAVVQTVDFFPPVVDDPYTYGAIAATNSMSDVFAMGGSVNFALNIAAFPENLPLDLLSKIFEGGADQVQKAGIVIAGGHTITDEEPKYGLVVTGTIHPDRVLTKSNAQPGDRLYITKKLGTGAVTTAGKQQAADPSDTAAAVESMLELNKHAGQIAYELQVSACTDITGFGLIGHASEMAAKSRVAIELDSVTIPWLPGAIRYAEEGRLPGGASRNREYFSTLAECGVSVEEDVSGTIVDLLYDPETSGGLLISVQPGMLHDFEDAFKRARHPLWSIGTVQPGRGITIR